MAKQFLVVSGLLLLGCGVPSNPEKGPVVLLCKGEQYLRSDKETTERQTLIQFYKVDGLERSLETWDSERQLWMGSSAPITITPNQISRRDNPIVMSGLSSIKTITFDRVAGEVHEDLATSDGNILAFDGACKPVTSPTSEKKF